MKVYVAGKFEDYEHVRAVQDFLEKLGHTITFDWTKEAQQQEELGRSQEQRSHATRLGNARSDVQGVEEADALVALMRPDVYGTMVEIGIAIADETPVYLVAGPQGIRYSIFWELPLVTVCKNDVELLGHFMPRPRPAIDIDTPRKVRDIPQA